MGHIISYYELKNWKPEDKLDYIFGDHRNEPIINRWDWIEDCLLGDIGKFVVKTRKCGGGNVTLPILITTAIELIASLYKGHTKYLEKDGLKYKPQENVKAFMSRYFDGYIKKIPNLYWDGVRNGLHHLFYPKIFKSQHNQQDLKIKFQFAIEGSSEMRHYPDNTILIKVNSIEFFEATKEAIKKYKHDLSNNENLQNKFIHAWSSFEEEFNINGDKKGEVQDFLQKYLNSYTYLFKDK